MGVPALGAALNPAACVAGPVTESGVGGRGLREGGSMEAAAAASVVVEQPPPSSPNATGIVFTFFEAFLCDSFRVQLKSCWVRNGEAEL